MAGVMTPDIDDDLRLRNIAATERLASQLSGASRSGDVICLAGELGSGKTTFARFFIRSRASRRGIEVAEVPSPTFTLVQIYELPDSNIWHFDLFRLEHSDETIELGIEDALRDGICLIEWPDRLPELAFSARLDLTFTFGESEDERHVRIVGDQTWFKRAVGLLRDE